MFVKKDLRKIEEILVDETDKREALKLAKRSPEFQGSIRILCRESKLSALENLKVLNLYDNSLDNLQGVGLLSQTPVEEINLGGNKLTSIPLEFGALSNLKALWLDDNQLIEFPICVCQLTELVTLRLSGNGLKMIPDSISSLQKLETLSIDNNELEEFPNGVLSLSGLKHLWARQNKLMELPETLDDLKSLETLSISSNKLTLLPNCLASMKSLKKIYANGNKLTAAPEDLCFLPRLEEMNLANNSIDAIPAPWLVTWGEFDEKTGRLAISEGAAGSTGTNGTVEGDHGGKPTSTTTTTSVLLLGNPLQHRMQVS